MAQVKGVVAGSMREVERSVNIAKSALAALGVGLSAGYLANMARDAVKAVSAFDDLAESTGATVEQLSRLQAVARVHGADMGAVTDGLVRLTRGLKGTEEETKHAAGALAALGIQAKTATGQLRDPGELMQEIAVKLNGFRDGAGKTALALDLFGKSGANLLPYLKDLATAGEYGGRVTAQQAAAAEQLENNFRRLALASELVKREFMIGLTPGLIRFTEEIVAAQKAGWGLVGALQMAVRLKLGLGGSSGEEIVSRADADLATLAKRERGLMQAAGANPGLYGGYAKEIEQVRADMRSAERRRRFGWSIATLDSTAATAGMVQDPSGEILSPPARAEAPRNPTAISAIRPARAGRVTDDSAKIAAELLKSETEHLRAAHAAWQARTDAITDAATATRAHASELEFEISLVGKSTAEAEKARALRRIDLDLRAELGSFKAKNIELSGEETQKLIDEAEARKKVVGELLSTRNALVETRAAQEAAARAAEDSRRAVEDAYRSRSDNLTRVISDGLMRGFERGSKSAAQVLIDTIKNALKTTVFEPVIHALVSPVSRAVTGAMMGLGSSSAFAGGGGGGLGGFGGLGNLLTSGFPSPTSFMNFGGLLGGTGAAASIGAMGAAGEIAMLTGSGVATGGVASTGLLSTLGPIGLGLGAAALLGGLFGEGGGPKQQEVIWNNGGSLGFGDNNITSQDPAYYAAAAAATRRLHDRFTAAELAKVPRMQVTGEPSSDPFQLLAQLESQVTSALAPAEQNRQAQAAMRGTLRAAQDPKGYWSGEVAKLQADLGTSADSLASWRAAFLSALEAPLSDDLFAKWNALGAALEGVANLAGAAASTLSTSGFRTLVDYRRAVRLAGGVPQFASGGAHMGGVRLVGEFGPELEFTGPSRIVSHGEARGMLDMSGVISRLEALRSDVNRALQAVALHTSRSARMLERFDGDGMPVRGVEPAQPILVRETPA